jgi:predicted secreted protein
MSRTTYYMILIPFGLSVLAGLITYVMRNELPDGTARPEAQRIFGGSWAFGIALVLTLFAVYFITWWVTLFGVLPLGVRSQQEMGAVVTGSEPGAPETHDMKRKVVLTTLISLPAFAAIILAVRFLPIL